MRGGWFTCAVAAACAPVSPCPIATATATLEEAAVAVGAATTLKLEVHVTARVPLDGALWRGAFVVSGSAPLRVSVTDCGETVWAEGDVGTVPVTLEAWEDAVLTGCVEGAGCTVSACLVAEAAAGAGALSAEATVSMWAPAGEAAGCEPPRTLTARLDVVTP